MVAITAEFIKELRCRCRGPPFATYVRMSEKIKGPEAASKRAVNAQDLSNGIRVLADALGLPADRFSPKSYRGA